MILLTKGDQMIFNTMFSNTKPIKEQLDIINNLLSESDTTSMIKDGIEKIKVEKEEEKEYPIPNIQESEKEKEKEKEKVNYMEILKHIIPLICLLTIHDKNTSFLQMFNLIKCNENIYNILLDQIQSWWGKAINTDIIKRFIDVYIKYVSDDLITNQIIKTVKELFMKNLNNNKQLSKIIDKYIIPQELEKKTNAEVSTPYKLRQEMLDKIPVDFWTKPHKVFEPCSGKGGFVIDIIDRFMTGLKDKYTDEKQRYKIIVEQCLYFSDINPTNIFICRLLIDPYSEYKLNFNEGNTLELDIKTKWDIDGFDAVIGNPPYESQNATGDNKLYLEFTKYALILLYKNAYLLFIVPINIKNYITNQVKNRSYINNFMEIVYLSINTSNKYFPNIGTHFSYFLIKKNIVTHCNTPTTFIRGKTEETSTIIINEKDNLPLCLSDKDFKLINKVSNLIKKNWETFNIKKAIYIKNNNHYTQRIRKTHIQKGDIKNDYDNLFKYKIIDKITKGNTFPGIFYYYNNKMIDYGKPKVIMCSGGYLMPSFDIDGTYNLSDNMIYLLIADISEYIGLTIIINSLLINYLNKVTMTDGIHGRDKVIQNIKKFNLNKIKCETDIYMELEITSDELELMKQTLI